MFEWMLIETIGQPCVVSHIHPTFLKQGLSLNLMQGS